ncbi:MAG: S-methyl-5-thioribose-1-phosphate isomerase [Alphaproteobacteria bacterium]|nr:S-methyl-5-thioribose-1-phosphate isomerase [Alphaproteobacteria bacterium]
MNERQIPDDEPGEHIRLDLSAVPHVLLLLDQRVLPRVVATIRCSNAHEAARAIRDMVVRGAPAIGITAAYGFALDVLAGGDRQRAAEVLLASRPTAVNLRWAIERMLPVPTERLLDEAVAIHREDVAINRAIGAHGLRLVERLGLDRGVRLYTHCNAGALATGGYGTAVGVIRAAHEAGRLERVMAGETRPYLQGARLTAWECETSGIPCTLVTDSMAAAAMAEGRVDAVVVGADRVAANGDVANKIGTYGLAVLAKHHGLPFWVAVPESTLDPRCPTGADIPIEERAADEVRGYGELRWAADVDVWNPAFDVTPAALVDAWITESGLWSPS